MSSEEQSVSVSEAPMSSDEPAPGGLIALVNQPQLWKETCEENGIDPVTLRLENGRQINEGYAAMCLKMGVKPSYKSKTVHVEPEEPLPAVDPTLPPVNDICAKVSADADAQHAQAMAEFSAASGLKVPTPEEYEENQRIFNPHYAAVKDATGPWVASRAPPVKARGPYNKKMPSPVGKMHPIEMARLAKEVSQPPVPLAKSRIGQLDPFPPHDNSLRHIKSLILEDFKRLAAKRAEEDKALALAASEATIAKLCEQGAGRTVTWSVRISPLVVVVLAATAAYAAYLYWAAS